MRRGILIFLPILMATVRAWFSDVPRPKVQKNDEAPVSQADLADHPELHTMLATWCRSMRLTEQAAYHEQKAASFQHVQERVKLKGTPVAGDWKRLLDLASRLEQKDVQAEARANWVAAEFEERRAKHKDTNLAGLKYLLGAARHVRLLTAISR